MLFGWLVGADRSVYLIRQQFATMVCTSGSLCVIDVLDITTTTRTQNKLDYGVLSQLLLSGWAAGVGVCACGCCVWLSSRHSQ